MATAAAGTSSSASRSHVSYAYLLQLLLQGMELTLCTRVLQSLAKTVDKIFKLVEHHDGQVHGVAAACSTMSRTMGTFSSTMASLEDQMTNYSQLQQQYHEQLQQQLHQQHQDQYQQQLQLHQEYQQQQQQLQPAKLLLTTVACQTSPSPNRYNPSRAFRPANQDDHSHGLAARYSHQDAPPQQDHVRHLPHEQQETRQELNGAKQQQQSLAKGSQALVQGRLPFTVSSPAAPPTNVARAAGLQSAAAAPAAAAAADSHPGHGTAKTSAHCKLQLPSTCSACMLVCIEKLCQSL